MRWLLVLILTGCLEPNLVPCGDLACPANAECVDNLVCATAEQLAACSDLADGASCQTSMATGYCSHGACTPNVCGDGVVTGNEVCDGSDLNATCVDLGYYSGTPACTSACTLDRTGCTGKCGDEIVQRDEGELCDGAPPDSTCTEFGADFGVLGCNRFCTPDIVGDCGRFGWMTVVPPRQGLFLNAGAVNAHGGIAVDYDQVRIMWDGVLATRTNVGNWQNADADATTMVGAGASSLGWFDGVGWHDLPFGFSTGVSGIVLLDGKVYGIDSACVLTAIDLAAQTSTTLPSPAGTQCGPLIEAGGMFYVRTTSGVARWDGTSWTYPVSATDVVALARSGERILASRTSGAVDAIDLGTQAVTTTAIQANPFTRLASNDDGEVLAAFHYQHSASLNLYSGQTVITVPRIPENAESPNYVTQSDDGNIVAVGQGLYRLSVVQGVLAAAPTATNITELRTLDDGTIAVCGDIVGWFGPTLGLSTSWGAGATAGNFCEDLVGDPRGAHLVSGGGIYLFDPSSGQYTFQFTVPGGRSQLTGTMTDAWAIYSPGALKHWDGSAWSDVATPSGCSVSEIAGGGPHPLYAIGFCIQSGEDKLLRLDGTVWTELATSGYANEFRVADDGTPFFNGAGLSRFDGSQVVHVADANLGFTALAADDVYVFTGDGVLEHRFGGQRATIRIPTGAVAVTPSTLVSFDAPTGSFLATTRRPISEAGHGL